MREATSMATRLPAEARRDPQWHPDQVDGMSEGETHGCDTARWILKEARQLEPNILALDFWYPRREPTPDGIREFEIGLVDVRAADSIRVAYDFERDGWAIKQAVWRNGEEVEWRETAFLKAWALDEDKSE